MAGVEDDHHLSFQGSCYELPHFIIATNDPSLLTLTKGTANLLSGGLGSGNRFPLQMAAGLIMTIPVGIVFPKRPRPAPTLARRSSPALSIRRVRRQGMNRCPTPGSVMKCRGRPGSASSLRRSWARKTRR